MTDRKSKQSYPPIKKGLVIGLDVGIGSCGWAVLNRDDKKILGMGAYCFDPSEDKTKNTKNKNRRDMRGQRRVIRRRRERMQNVRAVLQGHRHGLITDCSHGFFQKLGSKAPNPWRARAKGLTALLTAEEAASALLHIAKHRGFRSNSKSSKDAENPKDSAKMLTAIRDMKKYLETHNLTYGQMMLANKDARKRNREGDYRFTPQRSFVQNEATRLIVAQREAGAKWATEAFQRAYLRAAFSQRELQSSEGLVGKCPFEKGHRRTSRFSYSFERFRFFSKLANLGLDESEIDRVNQNLGEKKSFTLRKLKQKLHGRHIDGAPDKKAEKREVTGGSVGAFYGTNTLRNILLGSAWDALVKTPEVLDRIAEILTFNEGIETIRKRLQELGLDNLVLAAVMKAVERGDFEQFRGAGHVSAKAARAITRYLKQGKVYSAACQEAGYNHTDALKITLGDISNPVVARCLSKSVRQVRVLMQEFGRPEAIHIELLREVGKSARVRSQIEKSQRAREVQKKTNRENFLEDTGREGSPNELMVYELLKEQRDQCVYCDEDAVSFKPEQISDGRNAIQIDHIYPLSRSHDNSYNNKVFTCVKCNQDKGSRTPWEQWGGTSRWAIIEARVRGLDLKHNKKNRLLSRTYKEREERFVERNKVDSSYAARALQHELQKMYADEQEGPAGQRKSRRIFARPAPLTYTLRKVWLSAVYRKNREEDERHHAIDALVVAATNESALQKLTSHYKRMEQSERSPNVPLPWPTFASDAKRGLNAGWILCRTENRRTRGAGHKATLHRAALRDSAQMVFFERKKIDELSPRDLQRIPACRSTNPEIIRQHSKLIEDLKNFVHNKTKETKPGSDLWPCSPPHVPIRKIRLETPGTLRQINPEHFAGKRTGHQGGFVENTSITRVDVYWVAKDTQDEAGRPVKKGYYLVPVYNWQLMDKRHPTLMRAITAHKSNNDWPVMLQKDFLFSLYKNSYVAVTKKQSDPSSEGYFRSTDISSANITISSHLHRLQTSRHGVKRVSKLQKFTIDRLGRKHEIKREQWPGRESCPMKQTWVPATSGPARKRQHPRASSDRPAVRAHENSGGHAVLIGGSGPQATDPAVTERSFLQQNQPLGGHRV